MPQREWGPEELLAVMRLRNGVNARWHVDEAGTDRRIAGSVNSRSIQIIYGAWEGIVWFDDEPAEQREQMQAFKLVDYFADEACVGLFHPAGRDSQLYYYSYEDAPWPLGVDFMGYLVLLPHTLGLRYWQLLLRELGAPTAANRPRQTQMQEIVQRLQ